MPGVPSATLEGWCVRIVPSPGWDHVYATSSCGLRWGCWGSSIGGTLIASGTGSSIVADCLSQVNSRAGIVYGVTGVCHQSANRILYPAAVTVAAAGGYAVSQLLFGVYGSGAWLQIAACRSAGSGLATGSAGPGSAGKGGGTGGKRAGRGRNQLLQYDRAVTAVRDQDSQPEVIRLDELSELVQLGLDKPLDPSTFDALAAVQTGLRERQAKLADSLQAGRMSPEAYLDHLNLALRSAMDQSREVLGPQRFARIFGSAGEAPEFLIDRDRFLHQSGMSDA